MGEVMRGILRSAVAVVAALAAATACSISTSPAKATAQRHHHAAASTPSLAQRGQVVIESQGKAIPLLQTAGSFCWDGIKNDLADHVQDGLITGALKQVDPTGTADDVLSGAHLVGDEITVDNEYASGQEFVATFDLGQLIYALISQEGEKVTAGTPLEFQWQLFGLIGPAAIYCAEAAFWLTGTVGGQIGTALRNWWLDWHVSQQQLASQPSAITGKWVLYRKLANCAPGPHNNGCQLNPMDVTISCTSTGCSVIRTNSAQGFPPWDHSIPLSFTDGVWVANGPEQWGAQCNKAPVPGTTVALAVKVTSGQSVDGVWRAQGLEGSYSITVPADYCFSAGTSVEEVSTTPLPSTSTTPTTAPPTPVPRSSPAPATPSTAPSNAAPVT
jgi:hypothetical protein